MTKTIDEWYVTMDKWATNYLENQIRALKILDYKVRTEYGMNPLIRLFEAELLKRYELENKGGVWIHKRQSGEEVRFE